MSVSKGKCYLKRKRFLNEVSQEILTTLQRIYYIRNEIVSDSQIKEQAQNYAQKIEAVCLTPKYKMSNDEYHNILILKTQELCDVLKRNMLPSQTSRIPINAKQQQQPIKQTPQHNNADVASINDDNNYNTMKNDLKEKVSYNSESLFDMHQPSEMLINQQLPMSVPSQTVQKKNKIRKSNGKSGSASKASLNQRLSLSTIAQCKSEVTIAISARQNNNTSNNSMQLSYYGNIGNNGSSKPQLNCNKCIQDFASSNMDEFVDLQNNCVSESDVSCANYQNNNNLSQPQVQSNALPNVIEKNPFMRYTFDEAINEPTTVFSIASKETDLFPVIESNCAKADPFGLPDESFFDSSCIKEGLEFGDSLSFSLM